MDQIVGVLENSVLPRIDDSKLKDIVKTRRFIEILKKKKFVSELTPDQKELIKILIRTYCLEN